MLYRLTAVIWKEGDGYVSKAPEIGVASAGASPEEALANLREAAELYLENARLIGTLDALTPSLATEEKFTSTVEVSV